MKPECYDQIAKKDGFATVNDDQLAFVPCLLKFPGTAVYTCNLCFNPSSRSGVSRSALILITGMIFGTKKVAFVFLSFGFRCWLLYSVPAFFFERTLPLTAEKATSCTEVSTYITT